MINFFQREKQAVLISNSGREYIINPNIVNKIGRSPSEDIRIIIEDDLKVSRQHSEITCEKETKTYYIENLSTKHGTYVNGNKIEDKVALKSGDIITMGNYTRFTFEIR